MVYSKLPYDPDKDFKPLSELTTYEFVLAVPASSPAKDVKGLIEWMKKNPKEANFGSPAAGSLPHFFGLMISKYAGRANSAVVSVATSPIFAMIPNDWSARLLVSRLRLLSSALVFWASRWIWMRPRTYSLLFR